MNSNPKTTKINNWCDVSDAGELLHSWIDVFFLGGGGEIVYTSYLAIYICSHQGMQKSKVPSDWRVSLKNAIF